MTEYGDVNPTREMQGTQSEKKRTIYILTGLVVVGMLLRFVQIATNKTVTYDEAISYLAATCNEGSYTNAVVRTLPPVGQWTTASDWKKFVRVAKPLCFGTIATDLALTDYHPPLYFWMLHIWTLAVGVHPWTGLVMNVVVGVGGALLLYVLGREYFQEHWQAAGVALLWYLSPAVIQTSLLARQYELMAFFVIFYLLMIRRFETKRLNGYAQLGLTAAVAGGLLTHVQFLFVLFASILPLLIHPAIRKRIFRLLLLVGIGGAVALVVNPLYADILLTKREYALDLLTRFGNIVSGMLSFFFPERIIITAGYFTGAQWMSTILVFVGCVFLAVVVYTALFHRTKIMTGIRASYARFPVLTLTGFLLFLVTMLSYISGREPAHAMGERYLSMLWPFAALLGMGIAMQLQRRFHAAVTVVFVGMALSGMVSVAIATTAMVIKKDPHPLLAQPSHIIIDNLGRGTLPRYVVEIPDTTGLFVADRQFLLRHPKLWTTDLTNGDLYISDLSEGDSNAPDERTSVLRILKQRFTVTPLKDTVWGQGALFILSQKRL